MATRKLYTNQNAYIKLSIFFKGHDRPSCQSYKASTSVNYDSRAINISNLLVITTRDVIWNSNNVYKIGHRTWTSDLLSLRHPKLARTKLSSTLSSHQIVQKSFCRSAFIEWASEQASMANKKILKFSNFIVFHDQRWLFCQFLFCLPQVFGN